MKVQTILAWALLLCNSRLILGESYTGYASLTLGDRDGSLTSERKSRGATSTRYTSHRRSLGKMDGKTMGAMDGKRGKGVVSDGTVEEFLVGGKAAKGKSAKGVMANPMVMSVQPGRPIFIPIPTLAPTANTTSGELFPSPPSNANGTTTIAPTNGPLRTRPPRQPMRMRLRPPMNMGKMMGKASRTPSQCVNSIPYVVHGSLEFTSFPGTGMSPTNAEINSVVDETEVFFSDVLDANRLTTGQICDFRINNLRGQYAPGGDLDKFILYFDAVTSVPSNVNFTPEDVAQIMAHANFDRYIQYYTWEAEPFTGKNKF